MFDLAQHQNRFFSDILTGGRACNADLKKSSRVDYAHQKCIYRNNYFNQLLSTLQNDFSGLYAAMGKAAFRRVIAEFGSTAPPRHDTIRLLGKEFICFLGSIKAFNPVWLKLATVDWACVEVFQEKRDLILTLEQLSIMADGEYDQFTFEWVSALRCCEDPDNEGRFILFALDGNHLRRLPLRDEEWQLYRAISSHQTFAALCDAFNPEYLARTIQAWVGLGLFKQFSL